MATNQNMYPGIDYDEVFPKSFYDVSPYAKSVISTRLGQQPKRTLIEPFPARVVHSNYHSDIIDMAYQLRCKYPNYLSAIKTPQSWDELYDYFDAVDLWTQGPRFLMCVLDYIERFSSVFEMQDANAEYAQARGIVSSWGVYNNNAVLSSTSDQNLLATFIQSFEPARHYSPRQINFIAVCLNELRQQVFEFAKEEAKEIMSAPKNAQGFSGPWHPQPNLGSPLPQIPKSYPHSVIYQQPQLAYNYVPSGASFYGGDRIYSPAGMRQDLYPATTPRTDAMQPIYDQQHRFADRRSPYPPDSRYSPHRMKIPNGRVVSAPVSSPQRLQDRLGGGANVVYVRKEPTNQQRRRGQDFYQQSSSATGRLITGRMGLGNTTTTKSRPTPNVKAPLLTSIVENQREASHELGKTGGDRKDSGVDMYPPQGVTSTTTGDGQSDIEAKSSTVVDPNKLKHDSASQENSEDLPNRGQLAKEFKVEEISASSLHGDAKEDSTSPNSNINQANPKQDDNIGRAKDASDDTTKKGDFETDPIPPSISIGSVAPGNTNEETTQAGGKPNTRFSYSHKNLPSPQIEVLFDVLEVTPSKSIKPSRLETPNDARLTAPKAGLKGRTISCVHEDHRPGSMTLYYIQPSSVQRDTDNVRTAKFTGYNDHAVRSHLIMDMFSQCGPIETITYLPGRNLGYIQYASTTSVDEAIKTYNNWTMPNTTVIRVSYAQPPRRRTSPGRGASRSSNSSVCSSSNNSHNQRKDHPVSPKKENVPTDQPENTEIGDLKDQAVSLTTETSKPALKKKGKSGRNQKNNVATASQLVDSDFPPLAPSSKPVSSIVDGRPSRITTIPIKTERSGDKDWPFVKKCVSK